MHVLAKTQCEFQPRISKRLRSIWWVEDHRVLTSKMSISGIWVTGTSALLRESLTSDNQACRRWGLDRTARMIFLSYNGRNRSQFHTNQDTEARTFSMADMTSWRTTSRSSDADGGSASSSSSPWPPVSSSYSLPNGAVTESWYEASKPSFLSFFIAPIHWSSYHAIKDQLYTCCEHEILTSKAERCTVCGIQRRRASVASNSYPSSSWRRSRWSIIVSLLEALSQLTDLTW